MLAVFTLCFAATAGAQATVKGTVVDADSNEPLIGATVTVGGTSLGTVTDYEGNFTLKVTSAKATIEIKYLGYLDKSIKLTQQGEVNWGVVKMNLDTHTLGDVVVTSSIAVARKTPVAVSTVAPEFIEEKLGTMEFPEILKSTPGVYATKQGGGYGDSDINLRGFKTENIAVMVNGVPVNDMEWGGVYFSNWAGLSDVTRSTQVQRGLGASKVSVPSVGGSLNIVTRSTDAQKGGSISYGMGNDGMNSILFSVSTGLMKGGWAVSLLGGKKWGDGYIQGTDFEGYNYFLNVSKKLNDAHQLSFTAFGAPQSHYQRSSSYDGLTIQGWQEVKKYMKGKSAYRYNPSYGFGKNGERKSSNYNEYHKPQISLNHQWQIDDKSTLSTVAYVSIGRGNGYNGQGNSEFGYSYTDWRGASYGKLTTKFRNADGTFAYDKIQEINEQSENGSMLAMSKSKNYHNWYGLLSTFTTKLGENIDFYGGVDFRYYKGTHTNELSDLYGGEYYVDYDSRKNVKAVNNAAAADPNWKYEKLTVGDVVYRDYDGYVMQEGVFAQAEYNKDKLSAFLAGSVSNTGYWRYDRLYYDKQHAESETVNFIGWTAKGGANFNISDHHNVFANIGYISRAPFFSYGAFLSAAVSNATNPNAVNEKVFSAELGYGYRSSWLNVNLNAYYTRWMDKTMTKGGDILDENSNPVDRYSINMQGVDARHMGVELDFVAEPTRWLTINGMLSVGDWQWDSNATGYYYNGQGQPLADLKGTIASDIYAPDHAKSEVQLKGVKVGDSAQLTGALGATVKFFDGFRAGLDYNFYANNYADFALNGSSLVVGGVKTFKDPWKIPSGGQFDFNASYRFKIGSCKATLYGNINNVFNQEYIVNATDADGTWQNAYGVFYAFGRTYSLRLKINF